MRIRPNLRLSILVLLVFAMATGGFTAEPLRATPDATAALVRASAAHRSRHWKDVIIAGERSLRIDPSNSAAREILDTARAELASALIAQSRAALASGPEPDRAELDAAIAAGRQAVTLNPGSDEAFQHLVPLLGRRFRRRPAATTCSVAAAMLLLSEAGVRVSRMRSPQACPETLRVAFLAVLTVAYLGSQLELGHLYIEGLGSALNDQVGYVVTARRLADTGVLDSLVIYPSTMLQAASKNTLYMPGHYAALATSFKLFGYSVASAILPSLIGHLISLALLVFVVAGRYPSATAFWAGLCFLAFPANLIFSFTAMAEMELIACVLGAVAAFTRLSGRQQIWVGPFLVVPPLLFRETGAAIAAWMLIVAAAGQPDAMGRAVRFCALTAAVIAFVLGSPLAAGRPSLLQANVFVGSHPAIYYDATATQNLDTRPAAWCRAIASKFRTGLVALCRPPFDSREQGLESLSLVFILSGVPLGLLRWKRTGDLWGLGTASLVGVLTLLVLGLYSVWDYRGLRALLMCGPFVCLEWAHVLVAMERSSNHPLLVRAVVGGAILWIGLIAFERIFADHRIAGALAERKSALIGSIRPDPEKLLVSPFTHTLSYLEKAYPQRWAFVPANLPTWRALHAKYPIGCALLESPLAEGDARELGLTKEETIRFLWRDLHVYRGTKRLR